MGHTKRLIGLAATFAIGCGDSGGGSDGTADGTGTDPTNATTSMSGSSADETTSLTTSTTTNGSPCGNGVIDAPEECDDGSDNSDTEPNACRTNCRLPTCGDGVHDDGEECDDGGDNADFGKDACRTTCVLPSCGDGGVDTGEACDDGNEDWGDACYQCIELYYFVLNSPDLGGGGNVSILRATRDDGPSQVIVSGEPAYNGIYQLALDPDAVVLYAVQSSGSTDRVLFFNPETGALEDEADIGEGVLGYDPEARGIVWGSDGMLYVGVSGNGTTRIVSVDPANGDATEFLDLGSDIPIADMTADNANGVYISSTAAGSLEKVDISNTSSGAFANVPSPIGIAFNEDEDVIAVASNPPGGQAEIVNVDLAGVATPLLVVNAETDPSIRGLDIDVGDVPLTAMPNTDRVIAVQFFGEIDDVFTADVTSPTDVVVIDLAD